MLELSDADAHLRVLPAELAALRQQVIPLQPQFSHVSSGGNSRPYFLMGPLRGLSKVINTKVLCKLQT